MAPQVAHHLREEGVVILGMEGFDVRGPRLRARLDYIADNSSAAIGPGAGSVQQLVDQTADYALAFLALDENTPMIVEFIIAFADDPIFGELAGS